MRDKATAYLRQALANPTADFRPGQWECVDAILRNQRQLVVQKTGWGKSMAYFLGTRLLRDQGKGLTLLVSPLRSLMHNQIRAANRIGIRAETINSSNTDDWEAIEARLLANQADILLISPERLANDDFRDRVLQQVANRVGLVIVEEAHCISEWGHDFRPDYQQIVRVLQALPKNIPILATTATASDRVVKDVAHQLGTLNVVRGPLIARRRHFRAFGAESARMAWLAEHLKHLPGSGIIYTLAVRDSERVTEWLKANGDNVAACHSTINSEAEEQGAENAKHSRVLISKAATNARQVFMRRGKTPSSAEQIRHFFNPCVLGLFVMCAFPGMEAKAFASHGSTTPDAPSISFTADRVEIREGEGPLEIDACLSHAADATVTVAMAGTALPGNTNDYVLSATNLVFTQTGPTTQKLVFTPLQDALGEGAEYALLSFDRVAGAGLAGHTNIQVILRDDDAFTIMAANLTEAGQTYRAAGRRIFRGLLPDIVAIQEFNVPHDNHRAFVDEVFGTNFHFMVEPYPPDNQGSIPNGIISRWPIIAAGEWDDDLTWTRDFAWATIDLPGPRNLQMVSVHLIRNNGSNRLCEVSALMAHVQRQFPTNDYLVVAGDLNIPNRTGKPLTALAAMVQDVHKPADQNGDQDTSLSRAKDLDYVLPSPLLDALHLPLVAGGIAFPNGLVFDSTLWHPPPPPILPNDSRAPEMQHMAVMKAFALPSAPHMQIQLAQIEDDGDGDGLVEEGEPVRLTLRVENESGVCISNLAISITNATADIMLARPYFQRLGDWPAYYSSNAPVGSLSIAGHAALVDQFLSVQLASAAGAWTCSVPITIIAQRLPEALDNSALAFSNGGGSVWAYQTNNTWDGEDAAQCLPLSTTDCAFIETTVAGPGRISFCWQLESAWFSDCFVFKVDDIAQTGTYRCAWTEQTQLVPAGPHTLRWMLYHHSAHPAGTGRLDHVSYTPLTNAVLQAAPTAITRCVFAGQDASIPLRIWNAGLGDMAYSTTCSAAWLRSSQPAGSSTGELDRVTWSFTAGPAAATNDLCFTITAPGAESSPLTTRVTLITLPSIGDAISSNLTWAAGGSGGWFVQTNIHHAGATAVQSGAMGPNERAWIETTFPGPGTLSFWWKVSSESSNDCLRFTLDGIRQAPELSGEMDWQQQAYPLSNGMHVARWTYQKNSRVTRGLDAAWIADVQTK